MWAAGCVPTINTIGGHDEAELRQWAEEAWGLCLQRTGQDPSYPFTTDGCTLWPDGFWQSCCVEHDMAYWCGGSAEERRVPLGNFIFRLSGVVVILPLQLVGLARAPITTFMWLPMLVFELGLAMWLLIKGAAPPARRQSA